MSARGIMNGTAGPIAARVVCELLGVTETALKTLVAEAKLPALEVPAERRMVTKFFFGPLLAWLNARSSGVVWTEEMLAAELERARAAVEARDARKKMGKKG
jgi:cytochrome P450